jgi:hypothetical protein
MVHSRTTLPSAYQLAVSTCLRAFHVGFLPLTLRYSPPVRNEIPHAVSFRARLQTKTRCIRRKTPYFAPWNMSDSIDSDDWKEFTNGGKKSARK